MRCTLSMSLLGLRMETILANFHMCGIMLVLRAVFNMFVRNASPRGPMSEVISSFRSLTAGAQVFSLLMLFLCVIVHTMWSGKSL